MNRKTAFIVLIEAVFCLRNEKNMKKNLCIATPGKGKSFNLNDFIEKHPDKEIIIINPEKEYQQMQKSLKNNSVFFGSPKNAEIEFLSIDEIYQFNNISEDDKKLLI